MIEDKPQLGFESHTRSMHILLVESDHNKFQPGGAQQNANVSPASLGLIRAAMKAPYEQVILMSVPTHLAYHLEMMAMQFEQDLVLVDLGHEHSLYMRKGPLVRTRDFNNGHPVANTDKPRLHVPPLQMQVKPKTFTEILDLVDRLMQ